MKSHIICATPCGHICDDCPWFKGKKEETCLGCNTQKGKPFWGECEVYQCSEMQKVTHCGECQDFPCDTLINHFDPNNEFGPQEAIFRIGQLIIRAKIGTKEWLEKREEGILPNFR